MAVGLDLVLARGVAEQIITSVQAERLRALAAAMPEPPPVQPSPHTPVAPPPTQGSPSLVTEALGYLGGIIVVVGAILVGSQFWPGLGAGGRLAIVLVVAIALLVSGALVPVGLGPVGVRLRAVLLALSVVAFTGALSTLFYDVVDTDASAVPSLMIALATAYAFALWYWRPSVLQLGVAAAGTALTTGLVAGWLELPFPAVAAAVLAVGVVWLTLGWAALVRPRRATLVIGAAIAFVGGQLFVIGGGGTIWGLLTAIALVGVALHHRDLLLLGIGSVAVLFSLPVVIYEWFPSVLAAALSLLVVGGLLVAAAIYTARRKAPRSTTPDGSVPSGAVGRS